MHVIFIPYGKQSEVELLLSEMNAEKFKLKMWKDNANGSREVKEVWINGAVRLLPFGVVEYVFPREYLDHVLTALGMFNDKEDLSKMSENYQSVKHNLILAFIRRFLKAEKVPEYDKSAQCIWNKQHVNIIPIGIRRDGDLVGYLELDNGWTHEAI